MLFGSLAPEYGPRQEPKYRATEDTQLLKTVLQDSINLLEQVGWAVKAAIVAWSFWSRVSTALCQILLYILAFCHTLSCLVLVLGI